MLRQVLIEVLGSKVNGSMHWGSWVIPPPTKHDNDGTVPDDDDNCTVVRLGMVLCPT